MIWNFIIWYKNEYNNIYLENPDSYRKLKGVTETEKVYFLSEQYNINNINKDRALINTRSTFQTIQNNLSVQNPTDSLNDLFDNVKQSIIAGKNDYLDVLKDIFSKYMEYVRELREILSELGKSTKAGSKDGYINVNLDDLVNKLAILKWKIDSSKFLVYGCISIKKMMGDIIEWLIMRKYIIPIIMRWIIRLWH